MQLHSSKPASSDSTPDSALKEPLQSDGLRVYGRSPFLTPQNHYCSESHTLPQHLSQPLPHQLAKANRFGHHLGNFQTYSQVGYGTKDGVSSTEKRHVEGYRWPLQRHADRSAQDSHPRVIERSPIQTSNQPVQFIFGWVLRKMVKKTMRSLFPKRR
ncbi:MAG: hypothetical protein VKL39_00515 [Leptolyngbyaceae bacterium]|nr:hypothetical protein [Leptolyngbyaceae bacterium]